MQKFIKDYVNKGEVYLRVKVRPSFRENSFAGTMDDDTIKINISVPPIKGKANKELIKYLAQKFNTAKENIRIISDGKDRTKLIKITK
ncbi:MAG: DUF167 domain-containing protein [Patescibacteria group bacterium]|nr:DUF167 domain-containing protein [Patescibacteria group bacterium]